MKWYAAHLVMFFKYRKGKQRSFRVWENIVLIRARTQEEAFGKAERRGRSEEESDDDSLRIGGHPAKLMFAGVRKLVLCVDPTQRPADGTEITYTEMVFPSERAVHRFAGGEDVSVQLDDRLLDDEVDPASTDETRRRKAE